MSRKVLEDFYYSRGKYYDSNIYIFINEENKVLLIDPGSGDFHNHPEHVLWNLGLTTKDVEYIVLTHKHYNHFAAASKFKNAKIIAHELDANPIESCDETTKYNLFGKVTKPCKVDIKISNEYKLIFGKFEFTIFHTPGHTKGSICIFENNYKFLFTGDTLFSNGNISRTDCIEDKESYKSTLTKLLSIDAKIIFPGHGEPEDFQIVKNLAKRKIEIYNKLGIL